MEDPAFVDTSPRLRRAVPTDAENIRELVAAAYEPYMPLIGRTPIPMLTDYTEAVRLHETWVLDESGALTGVLENVAVLPARQSRGLGRRLLSHAEFVAREWSLKEIRLLTNERYLETIAMYQRHGYRETHRRPHLGTDLVYFAKPLDLDPGT